MTFLLFEWFLDPGFLCHVSLIRLGVHYGEGFSILSCMYKLSCIFDPFQNISEPVDLPSSYTPLSSFFPLITTCKSLYLFTLITWPSYDIFLNFITLSDCLLLLVHLSTSSLVNCVCCLENFEHSPMYLYLHLFNAVLCCHLKSPCFQSIQKHQ